MKIRKEKVKEAFVLIFHPGEQNGGHQYRRDKGHAYTGLVRRLGNAMSNVLYAKKEHTQQRANETKSKVDNEIIS